MCILFTHKFTIAFTLQDKVSHSEEQIQHNQDKQLLYKNELHVKKFNKRAFNFTNYYFVCDLFSSLF